MTREQIAAVASLLLTTPIILAWLFVLVDVARRKDLWVVRKLVYAVILFFAVPATLLYLLSRPTSIVRHRPTSGSDWRSTLMDRLEQPDGAPPVLGPREEQLMLERVLAAGASERS